MIDASINVIVSLLLLIGTFFILSSSIGIFRFPDVYTRLHAATKSPTLGSMCVLLATFLFLYGTQQIVSGKLLLAILFVFITSPIGSHLLSRAAHARGIKPVLHERGDALEEVKRKEQN